MNPLLLFCFLCIFGIAFGAAVLMLRTPGDQRTVERRLELLLPAVRENHTSSEAFFKEKPRTANSKTSWAREIKPMQRLEDLLYQSKGHRSVGQTVLAIVASAAAAFLVVDWVTGMLPIGVLAAVLCGTLPVAYLYKVRQKRIKAFEASLPDCIDMCSRALRAGHSLVAAIGMVAEQSTEPAKAEFAEVFKKQNYGLPLRDALVEMLDRTPSADLRVFLTGIFVQKDTGGNLPEIFDRIVAVIRDRIRIQGDIRVHTAQGRITAWILTLLPVCLLLVINLIDPGYSRPMFQDELGKKLMYAGALLLVMGGLVVRRIVNGIEV